MMMAYDYDPDIHQIMESSKEAEFLRRELKLPNLVVYIHKVIHRCVVSLKENNPGNNSGRPQLMDLHVFDPKVGLAREDVDILRAMMGTLIPTKAKKKQFKDWAYDSMVELDKNERGVEESKAAITQELKKRHGPMVAERWHRRATGGFLSKPVSFA